MSVFKTICGTDQVNRLSVLVSVTMLFCQRNFVPILWTISVMLCEWGNFSMFIFHTIFNSLWSDIIRCIVVNRL